ncbi:carbohydrate ABC transporter permease [Alicyclobacillus acidiphilus]|uniref:carbohydrate ABC transporter permease n=1 Tax=Alicyclobacillus acidiphilus TaxID=182455 RepID=UPI0012EE25C1|nr:carbohydrate ABC transporter permease [Alicyclobacillus acidiphilus]
MAARRIRRLLRGVIALAIGLVFLLPIYITLTTSLDTPAHVFTYPPHFLLDFNWSVWVQTWKENDWLLYILNTVVIAVGTIAIAIVTTVLAAYALSFIPFRGQAVVFSLILLVLMIPSETFLIPNFVTMAKLHLVDTRLAQILPYGATAFGIFLLRQFFLSLPRDYWEAARMDGCGHLRFLWSIAVPLCRPVLFVIVLDIFIGCWNSLLWPLMVTNSPKSQPIEAALAQYLTQNSSDWQGLSAAAMFATIPMIILYIIFQRHIVRGISRGEGIRF